MVILYNFGKEYKNQYEQTLEKGIDRSQYQVGYYKSGGGDGDLNSLEER